MAQPWTEDDPGSVELGCMTNSASALTTASTHYWNAASSLGTTKTSVSEWSGAAAEAWRASLGTLVVDLGASRDRILDGKAAIMAYRSTTESISNRAATAKHNLKRAQAVYHEPQPNQVTDPVGFETWQNDRYMAGYHEQDARNEIYRLALERYAADDDAIRGLAAALPADWTNTLSALASVGITGVGDLTKSVNEDALLELSQRIADGEAKPEDYDALALLLGMYQNNESVMSTLFTELGGEGTIKLVDDVGDQYGLSGNAALLALAATIRGGLSVASANWDTQQAKDFTSTMISSVTMAADPDGNAAIAYLFSDPEDSPMGETFTYQLAVAIDASERDGQMPIRSWDPRNDQGGNSLFLAENPGIYDEMRGGGDNYEPGILDSPGMVFATLGLYPESSFNFLATDPLGADRVEYWFGQRNWDEPDGFHGPAALWLGASQVHGGPTSGTAYDDATGLKEAQLTSDIFNALKVNPSFETEAISAQAGASFGTVIAMHLDGLALALTGSPDGSDQSYGVPVLFTDYETGMQQWTAYLDPKTVGEVLGAIGGTPTGALVMQVGSDATSERIMDAAGTDPALVSGAINQISKMQGMLDGSGVGATLGAAAQSDAEMRELIANVTSMPGDILGTAVGFAPIPGGPIVSGSIGVAVSVVSDWVTSGWADGWYAAAESYSDAADAGNSYREYGIDHNASTLAHLLYDQFSGQLGLVGPPPQEAGLEAMKSWTAGVINTVHTGAGVDVGEYKNQYTGGFDQGQNAGQTHKDDD